MVGPLAWTFSDKYQSIHVESIGFTITAKARSPISCSYSSLELCTPSHNTTWTRTGPKVYSNGSIEEGRILGCRKSQGVVSLDWNGWTGMYPTSSIDPGCGKHQTCSDGQDMYPLHVI
jgi:hypothetical protein